MPIDKNELTGSCEKCGLVGELIQYEIDKLRARCAVLEKALLVVIDLCPGDSVLNMLGGYATLKEQKEAIETSIEDNRDGT